MLFFLIGPFILGIAWIAIFWLASFMIYLIACLLSLLGICFDISGDRNVWLLFIVVCGIAYCVFAVGNFGYAIFVFLTGAFMLFRSADTWKISG
jgi:hypothetical protein